MPMKNIPYPVVLFLLILGWILLIISPVTAMPNPSAVYCEALGYQYSIQVGSDGGMTGFCTLPNNQTVSAWKFLLGKEGQEFNYCKKQGYESRISENVSQCNVYMTRSCVVCIMPNGSQIEVTKAMNLPLKELILESTCGDGVCGSMENFNKCPQDCIPGRIPISYWILLIAVIIIILIIIILKIRKPV